MHNSLFVISPSTEIYNIQQKQEHHKNEKEKT